ncbi:MAG: 3-dehydroquinate dehydratase [Solirubrobacterales bacterium]|nr:3-dehydroquinate dehydratase [Solirubrobacterales bacterium]
MAEAPRTEVMRAHRIEVMHGVNLDMLGKRDPAHYGTLGLLELERRIEALGAGLGLRMRFFQSNAESAFVERLHRLREEADGLVINPGAWTHYSWAIHDALEIAALPAVEVHLSDIEAREPWRRVSVVEDLCLASFLGQGLDGYRQGLEVLRRELDRRQADDRQAEERQAEDRQADDRQAEEREPDGSDR